MLELAVKPAVATHFLVYVDLNGAGIRGMVRRTFTHVDGWLLFTADNYDRKGSEPVDFVAAADDRGHASGQQLTDWTARRLGHVVTLEYAGETRTGGRAYWVMPEGTR